MEYKNYGKSIIFPHTVDKNESFHTWAHIVNNELVCQYWLTILESSILNLAISPEWEGEIPESLPPPKPPLFYHFLLNPRCLILRLLIFLLLLELRTAVSFLRSRNYLKFFKSIPALQTEKLDLLIYYLLVSIILSNGIWISQNLA